MKQLILAAATLAFSTFAHAALPLAFHNMALTTFEKGNDFQSRGLGPATFSIYNTPNANILNAAGVFDAQHAQNVLKSSIDERGIVQFSSDMSKTGFSVKSLSVAVPQTNNQFVLFSAIYQKVQFATASVWGLNDQQWDVAYSKWIKQSGYRISDYIQWPENGENRHSVTFVKDGQPAMYVIDVTRDQFAASAKQLESAGWQIDNFHVSLTVDNKYKFSGIWLRQNTSVVYYYNIDANTYKQHFNELAAQGFHVKKVFGYGVNGGLFGAIWTK